MSRIIYSLKIEMTPDGMTWLVAPLDRAGQSSHVVPCLPKKRAIDLQVGDQFEHGGKRHTVCKIEAYRDAEGEIGERADGYVVRKS